MAINDPAVQMQQAQSVADQQGVAFSQLPASPTTPLPSPVSAFTENPLNVKSPTMTSGLNYVDPDKSTVRGQLTSLLAEESPYIQQARLQASEKAAGRGMLNTSMAAGAGQRAAIQSGFDIASQDANTYANAQGRQQEGDITGALENAGYQANFRQSMQDASTQERRDILLGNQDITRDELLHSQNLERDAQSQEAQLENIMTQGEIQQRIAELGFASQAELQEAAIAGNQDAIRLQGQINLSRDAQQQYATRYLDEMKVRSNEFLTQLGYDTSTANTYTNVMGSLMNTVTGLVGTFLNNTDITDIAGAIDVITGIVGSTGIGLDLFDPSFTVTGRPGIEYTVPEPGGSGPGSDSGVPPDTGGGNVSPPPTSGGTTTPPPTTPPDGATGGGSVSPPTTTTPPPTTTTPPPTQPPPPATNPPIGEQTPGGYTYPTTGTQFVSSYSGSVGSTLSPTQSTALANGAQTAYNEAVASGMTAKDAAATANRYVAYKIGVLNGLTPTQAQEFATNELEYHAAYQRAIEAGKTPEEARTFGLYERDKERALTAGYNRTEAEKFAAEERGFREAYERAIKNGNTTTAALDFALHQKDYLRAIANGYSTTQAQTFANAERAKRMSAGDVLGGYKFPYTLIK